MCGACYEVPEQLRAEVGGGGARVVRRDLLGHAGARHRRRACAPSSPPPGATVVDASALHPRGRGPASPTAAQGQRVRPARRPGRGCARERPRRARRSPASLEAVREPDRAPPAPGRPRSADEVTLTVVTKFFPGLRRTPARRARRAARGGEPAPGGRGQGGRVRRPRLAGTSSAACRATRPRRSRRTPTWSSPWTAPSCSPALSRGAHQRDRAGRRAWSRSASTRPGAAGRAGRRARRRRRRSPSAVAAAEGLRLRGVMAVAPLGRGPGAGVRAAGRGRRDYVRRVDPAATWVSAGMSGDLEAAVESGATHVRIGSAVLGSRPPTVVSSTQQRAPSGAAEVPEAEVMGSAMRKMGVYLGLLEDTERYDDEYYDEYDEPDPRAVPRRSARPSGARREHLRAPPSERRRPAAGRPQRPSPSCPGSPRCTRAPTTRRAPSVRTSARASR